MVIQLSNHITAAPGKQERLRSLLAEFVKKVHETEPGVLEFKVYDAPAQNSFQTFEIYESQEAINNHLATDHFKHLIRTQEEEGIKGGPNQVLKPLDEVYSFSRR